MQDTSTADAVAFAEFGTAIQKLNKANPANLAAMGAVPELLRYEQLLRAIRKEAEDRE